MQSNQTTHGSFARYCAARNNLSPKMIRFFCPSNEYLSHSLEKILLEGSLSVVKVVVTLSERVEDVEDDDRGDEEW